MTLRLRSYLMASAAALALGGGLEASGPAEEAVKRLDIVCLTGPPPKIDGHIDDAIWQSLQPVSGFFQYDPINGVPASEETFVWAAYDQDYLYFAFLMKDSQPDRIWAELTPRNEWENNDSIAIILDAYNDKRTSVTFELNPRGVQKNSVDRIDVQAFDLMAGYAWRFDRGLFKRLSLDLGGEIRQDSHGRPTAENLEVMFFSDFFNRLEIDGRLDFGRSKYQVVDDEGELIWTPDYVDTRGAELEFDWERGGFLKEVSLEVSRRKRGVYAEDFTAVMPGSQTNLEGRVILRPRSNLEWSVEGDWIRQKIDESGEEAFNGLAYETALHYQVTRHLFLNTRLFGETRDDQYSLDVLFGYYFGAGNIVQLSFKKSERNELLGRVGGYSVTLKVSYLLRL